MDRHMETRQEGAMRLKQGVVLFGLGLARARTLLLGLRLLGHTKEQTGVLAVLEQMAQIAAVGRISVVLEVPTVGGIGQSLEPGARLGIGQGLGDVLGANGQRRLAADGLAGEQVADAVLCVVAGDDAAAGSLNGGNGVGGGARHHDVDGGAQHGLAAREQLDAVLDAADEPALDDFLDGDLLGGVEAAGVDPVLQVVEVDGGELGGAAVGVC